MTLLATRVMQSDGLCGAVSRLAPSAVLPFPGIKKATMLGGFEYSYFLCLKINLG